FVGSAPADGRFSADADPTRRYGDRVQFSRWRSFWRTDAEAVPLLVAVSVLVSVSVLTAVLWDLVGDDVNKAGLWVSTLIQIAASLALLGAYRAPVGGTVVVVAAATVLVLLTWIAPDW